jgi:hypothetical protein
LGKCLPGLFQADPEAFVPEIIAKVTHIKGVVRIASLGYRKATQYYKVEKDR